MDGAAAVVSEKKFSDSARGCEDSPLALKKIGDAVVSTNTIERVVGDVGAELAARREADPKTAEALARRPESPPELAVVECDGGRIRTRIRERS